MTAIQLVVSVRTV